MTARVVPAPRVAVGSLLLAGSQLAVKMLGFALVVALTRNLTIEQFGQWAFAFALAGFFMPFIELGLDTHITRVLASEPEHAGDLLAGSIGLKTALFAVALAVAVGTVVALGHPQQTVVLVALALAGGWLTALAGSWIAVYRSRRRLDVEAGLTLGGRALGIMAALAAVLLGTSIVTVAAAQSVGALVAFVAVAALGVRVRLAPGRGPMTDWRHLARGGWPFAVTAALVMVYFRIDALMLGQLRGERSVALYSVGVNVLFAILLLSSSLVTAIFPRLAAARSLADPAVRMLIRRTFTISLALSIPFTVAGWALGTPILGFLFGASYSEAGRAFGLLLTSLPVLFLTNVVGNALGATGQQSTVLAVAGANAALNVVLNMWLIPRMDYAGAALATLLTECVGLATFAWLLRREFPGWIDLAGLWRVALANGALAGFLVVFRSWPVPLLVVTTVALYLIAVLILGIVRPADLRALPAADPKDLRS